jgi:hypothetical protein
MKIIKKHRFLSIVLITLIFSSCASWQNNYGKLRILKESRSEVTIQDLIDKWDDYNIYYSDIFEGYHPRAALGVMFDPKNDGTTLVGDHWKKVKSQKDLIDITKWIYSNTQYEPWLNEILGPDGRVYGYLYYSYGGVTLKMIDDKTMYVFNLEGPYEEGDGEPHSSM